MVDDADVPVLVDGDDVAVVEGVGVPAVDDDDASAGLGEEVLLSDVGPEPLGGAGSAAIFGVELASPFGCASPASGALAEGTPVGVVAGLVATLDAGDVAAPDVDGHDGAGTDALEALEPPVAAEPAFNGIVPADDVPADGTTGAGAVMKLDAGGRSERIGDVGVLAGAGGVWPDAREPFASGSVGSRIGGAGTAAAGFSLPASTGAGRLCAAAPLEIASASAVDPANPMRSATVSSEKV